jgi:hypothetical protein
MNIKNSLIALGTLVYLTCNVGYANEDNVSRPVPKIVNTAMILCQNGEFSESAEKFTEADELAKRHPGLYPNLSETIKMYKHACCYDLFKQAVEGGEKEVETLSPKVIACYNELDIMPEDSKKFYESVGESWIKRVRGEFDK